MDWSPQQQRALDEIGHWLRERNDPVRKVFGYAGTGKTTLAIHFAQNAGNVLFAAYTGKAASVMRRRGCPNASTIHQLIYMPSERSKELLLELIDQYHEIEVETPVEERPNSQELQKLQKRIDEEKRRLKKPVFTLNLDSPLKDADLLIIDEVSMVDPKMAQDLLWFGVPILALGDPAQLPPVKGGGYFTSGKPDIMLTEIHRQARDNPIIELASRVRQGLPLGEGRYGESLVVSGKPDREMVMAADQILVGKNETRRKCNRTMRKILGHSQVYGAMDGELNPYPIVNDKLVCLRNDHDAGLLNGTLWKVTEACPEASEGNWNNDRLTFEIEGEDSGTRMLVEAHAQYFEGREDELSPWLIREAQCFDYGYALTCHKAQGSQWPSVFVFDESQVFGGTANRWLYTAITRASEKVVICRQ